MIHLQRITTEYVDTEDRIRLSGEVEDNLPIVLWLTQRLLTQLITHLLGLIEKQSLDVATADSANPAPASSLMQGFAQQAAQAELAPEIPVRATDSAQSWLVLAVDFSLSPEGALVLVFKRDAGTAAQQEGEDAGKATLTVEAKQLRQWLGIVHAQWQRAGWPLKFWPTWMDEQMPSDNASPMH
jgi:hypothetical protein